MAKFQMPTLTMTADIVIFTVRSGRLEVLLIERGHPPFKGCWALPGGLVEEHEALDECAARELEEETGVAGLSLMQVYTYGDPDRDPRGRLVTVAYVTLVKPDRLKPRAGDDAKNVGWFAADKLPKLAFDHKEIIETARIFARQTFDYWLRAFNYLPREFTLSEVRGLCEALEGKPLEPRAFRRRVLALELIEETGKTRQSGGDSEVLYREKPSKAK